MLTNLLPGMSVSFLDAMSMTANVMTQQMTIQNMYCVMPKLVVPNMMVESNDSFSSFACSASWAKAST